MLAAMPVQRIAIVTIQARDFDTLVAWYRDVLGLEIGWLEPGEFCTLTAAGGGASIAVATYHPERLSPRPGTGWTPTFAVDDFDGTIAALRRRGVTFDAEEEGAEEGYRLVRGCGPQGKPRGAPAE